MALFRLLPIVGEVMEKAFICFQGDVPRRQESAISRLIRRYRATTLNTFDAYGSHAFQQHKTDAEIRSLLLELQPEAGKILNQDAYFSRPVPIGCALRVFK
jgi:hypothetical protein